MEKYHGKHCLRRTSIGFRMKEIGGRLFPTYLGRFLPILIKSYLDADIQVIYTIHAGFGSVYMVYRNRTKEPTKTGFPFTFINPGVQEADKAHGGAMRLSFWNSRTKPAVAAGGKYLNGKIHGGSECRKNGMILFPPKWRR